MSCLNIAIDGPAGAGKSTVAKEIAKRLGIRYLDTGAMYRAMALHAERNGVACTDAVGLERILPGADITVQYAEDGTQHTFLQGEDVTLRIRTPSVSMGASKVGVFPPVRKKLAQLQREIGMRYDVVMDGRDITTFVLPDTKHKFFVTASPEERARRRYLELQQKGDASQTLEEVIEEIRVRDERDSGRDYMPLRQAEDAALIDTTGMTVSEVAERMLKMIEEKEHR